MCSAGKRWTKIDDRFIENLQLDKSDYCFFYLERTSGGYLASEANQRIKNFKHDVKYKSNPTVWGYKQREIERFADDVCDLLNGDAFKSIFVQYPSTALVPIPTHHPKKDALYDSRLFDMCSIIASRIDALNVEDVFDMAEAVTPAHAGGSRNISSIGASIILGDFSRRPNLIILVDDVLTTGAHYVACRNKIRAVYPSVPIIGIFLAKQKYEDGRLSSAF